MPPTSSYRLPIPRPSCARCHWFINIESESVNRVTFKAGTGRPRPHLLDATLCDECTRELIAVVLGGGIRSFDEIDAEEGGRIRALGY